MVKQVDHGIDCYPVDEFGCIRKRTKGSRYVELLSTLRTV
jgi:hypothetical protein